MAVVGVYAIIGPLHLLSLPLQRRCDLAPTVQMNGSPQDGIATGGKEPGSPKVPINLEHSVQSRHEIEIDAFVLVPLNMEGLYYSPHPFTRTSERASKE